MNLWPFFEALHQLTAWALMAAGVLLAIYAARQIGALLDELFPPEDLEDELYRRRDREWPEDK